MVYANETADDGCAILLRVALWPLAALIVARRATRHAAAHRHHFA
jgi:hypothetical protein